MGLTKKGNLIEMQNLAKLKGGACLSKIYVNSKITLRWKCIQGHKWEASPFSVKTRDSWCPKCANNIPLGIEKMKILAKFNHGKCLSDEYKNVKTKLLWQCKNRHQFMASPHSVREGRWCLKCK